MWTDSLLFWAVLIWMLLLGATAFFSVRALLRDQPPGDVSSAEERSPGSDETGVQSPSPPSP